MQKRKKSTNKMWQHKCMQVKRMYLKLELIKQYRASGRSVLLVLRLPRKKKKGMERDE